jgi:hypothetical protein
VLQCGVVAVVVAIATATATATYPAGKTQASFEDSELL